MAKVDPRRLVAADKIMEILSGCPACNGRVSVWALNELVALVVPPDDAPPDLAAIRKTIEHALQSGMLTINEAMEMGRIAEGHRLAQPIGEIVLDQGGHVVSITKADDQG